MWFEVVRLMESFASGAELAGVAADIDFTIQPSSRLDSIFLLRVRKQAFMNGAGIAFRCRH